MHAAILQALFFPGGRRFGRSARGDLPLWRLKSNSAFSPLAGYTLPVPDSDPHPVAPASPPPDELTTQVYEQLRLIARAKLASQAPGHTLQATALVHEVYLKFQKHLDILATHPERFFHAAAQAMRQILIDHARARGRIKRGGGIRREFADVAELADDQNPEEIVALDEAISRLEVADPRAAQVVKLRFFAGLSVAETAQALAISERTVKRNWQFARAWLYRALEISSKPRESNDENSQS
jgi:RNA polymerase sigma factor (TIGR02999 family)